MGRKRAPATQQFNKIAPRIKKLPLQPKLSKRNWLRGARVQSITGLPAIARPFAMGLLFRKYFPIIITDGWRLRARPSPGTQNNSWDTQRKIWDPFILSFRHIRGQLISLSFLLPHLGNQTPERHFCSGNTLPFALQISRVANLAQRVCFRINWKNTLNECRLVLFRHSSLVREKEVSVKKKNYNSQFEEGCYGLDSANHPSASFSCMAGVGNHFHGWWVPSTAARLTDLHR